MTMSSVLSFKGNGACQHEGEQYFFHGDAQFSQKMMEMISRSALVSILAALTAISASAQDPVKTLPGAYTLQLENAHVRVVRVHYGAGAKLAEHTHPAGTTVYVYLNDSDGVIFAHTGRSNRAVTRPAVTAGSVRIATGGEEHHTAENPASTPSDFLRIWLKTDGVGERTMRRLSPADQSFDNKQMRVTRLTVGASGRTSVEAPANQPALLIAVPSGDTTWIDAGRQHDITTPGAYLRLDLLTSPRS